MGVHTHMRVCACMHKFIIVQYFKSCQVEEEIRTLLGASYINSNVPKRKKVALFRKGQVEMVVKTHT